MKKIIALLLAVFLCVPLFAFVLAGCTSYDETLVVYNWEDYIDIDLLDEFCDYYEETTGSKLKIIYSTFDTNETMLANVTQGGAEVDLICPSEYAVQKLIDKDFIKPFPKSEMTHLGNLNPVFEEQIDEVFDDYTVKNSDGAVSERLFDYVVPYMWGTLGILYNTEVISPEQAEEAGWGLLWNATNIPNVDKTILMKDSIRDVYVATLLYAKEIGELPEAYLNLPVGELINTVNAELLSLAERLLIAQRPKLKGYEVDLGKDDMIAGKANVNLAWSGDAMYALFEDEAGILDYFVPNDTGNVWFDGWVMPKNAKNERAAAMFVDFLLRPESAIRNMMYIGYTSAVDKSAFEALEGEERDYIIEILEENDFGYEILEENEFGEEIVVGTVSAWEDFFENEVQYPTDLENLGVMRDFQNENATVVSMWERVKSESDNDMTIAICLIVIFGVAAAIALGALLYKVYDKKYPKRNYIEKTEADVSSEPSEK